MKGSKDMNRQKEEMINVAKKVVENIDWMSFVDFDDQQVHSIVRIREIARGIVDNKVEKVSSCRDLDGILGGIGSECRDNGHSDSVSRMKENVATFVTKQAKLATTRNYNPAELVEGIDAVTAERKVDLAMVTSNKSVDIEGFHKRLFSNEVIEMKFGIGNDDENQGNVIDETLHLGNEDAQFREEESIVIANGETQTCNVVQNRQLEGMMFEDVELVAEEHLSIEYGQHEMQETLNGTSELRNESSKNKVKRSAVMSAIPLSVTWPADGKIALDWVKHLMATLEWTSKKVPPSDFQSVMPVAVVDELVTAASSILSKEPNCVEVDCHGEDSSVVVVGDIHGQFHDLLYLFVLAGLPSPNQSYVFNGDYVDRGAWGLEVLLVLLAWKVLMPNRVYLLRGNHETGFCTSMYGFEQEVKTKFGDQGEKVYKKFLECFKELPLASIISSCVYTTHGGLFRSMNVGPLRRSKRKRVQKLKLGSLEDLSKVNRHLIDVADEDPSVLTDVLWSDPSKQNGLIENADRGLGLSWGPDCTEMFLKKSKLKLMIRSHQGPDARVDQDDFGDMMNGYSMDHVGESGKIYTLFSAPSYPQFGETTYNNEGAYAVLKPPNFEKPSFYSFKAVERPKVEFFDADYAEFESRATEKDLTSIPTTHGSSASQANFQTPTSSRVEFEALGISNPPSWSVPLVDNAGGTKVVQLPKVPSVEGLPLPSSLQEPYKAAFEYLFELVATLKYMLSTRVIEGEVLGSARERSGLSSND